MIRLSSLRDPDSEEFRMTAIILICAVVSGLILFLHWQFVPLREAENQVQDWVTRLGRSAPADPRLVLIGIDQPTYEGEILESEAAADPVLAAMAGGWPWSRQVWATLIERLGEAGAKVIVIDLVFAGPGEGDDALREAVNTWGDKVVIASTLGVSTLDGRGSDLSLTVPYDGILEEENGRPVALDDRVGFVNIWADEDGVLRRAEFRLANRQIGNLLEAWPEEQIESLAARALHKMGEGERIPAGPGPFRFRYTAPPDTGYPVHRIGDVLWPSTWKANYLSGEFFRDKVVLIGPTAQIFQDRHRTPFTVPTSEMLGPEIHLNIINAALQGEFLTELPLAGQLALIVLLGGLAGLVSLKVRSPLRLLGALLGISLICFGVGQALYNYANYVLVVVSPLLTLNLAGAVAMTFDFVLERLKRARLRHTMSLYFSPRVLDAVLADPGSMDPRRAEVTLLLTDLRNSTPLAELLGPIGMFNLLNRIFEVQTEAIMGEDGNLEHFLGDQFLSYWGAPQPQPDGAAQAHRSALKLIRAMEEVRASLPPEVKALFGYGVALHGGSVLVGNKGSSRRLDYGLVGDAVNEAARVEALTKKYGVKLLVTREIIEQLGPESARRFLDRVIVKGKSVPVDLFELENPCTPQNYVDLCRRYEEAYADYAAGRFEQARKEFKDLEAEFQDGPSKVLAERCGHLLDAPPAEWKGIWSMESK